MKRKILLVLVALFGMLVQANAQQSYYNEAAIGSYKAAVSIAANEIIGQYCTRDVVEQILSKYKTASRLDPRIHTAWINQALCYATLQRYDSAFMSLNKGIKYCEADNDRAEIFLRRGYIQEECGKINLANESYDSALAIIKADTFRVVSTIVNKWEATLARYGLDKATEYLRDEMAAGGLDAVSMNMLNDLKTNSTAKVQGRTKYIHSKASGVIIVSPQEMDEIRTIHTFYENFVKDMAESASSFIEILKNRFLAPALLDKTKGHNELILNMSAEEFKKIGNGGIYIEMNQDHWYKVRYYLREYRRDVTVHVTDNNNRVVIDDIKL
jgi:tetratricopeptide (TPR) repeat protein